MSDLYTTHETGLQVVFSEVERYALAQEEVFAGTPGSLTRRTKPNGSVFYSRQYYDGSGKKREVYVAGPEGSPTADQKVLALDHRIAEAARAVASIRLLGRSGYTVADAKAQATLAILHNLGFFAAGGVLVGSHAFGALLNKLGVRAAPYAFRLQGSGERVGVSTEFERHGQFKIERGNGVTPRKGALEALDEAACPEKGRRRGRERPAT